MINYQKLLAVTPLTLVTVLMVSCDSLEMPATSDGSSSPTLFDAGEMHNAGVRYVIEGLDTDLPPAAVQRAIVIRTEDWCRRTNPSYCIRFPTTTDWCLDTGHYWCPQLGGLPPYPTDRFTILEASGASPALRTRLDVMLTAMERARTLEAFNAAADRSLEGVEALRPAEAQRLADIASVLRGSAALWAPVSEGGQGAFDEFQFGERQARTDWWDVAFADVVGCVLGWEMGCVGPAIISSTWEWHQQNK